MYNNTIAGIASGMGGGIGIIRISGDKALEAAGKIFRTKSFIDKKLGKVKKDIEWNFNYFNNKKHLYPFSVCEFFHIIAFSKDIT